MKTIKSEEKTKRTRDTNFREFTSEELGKLISKGTNVVGGK